MIKLTDLEICKRIAEINGDNVLMMKSALGSNWMIAGEGHGGYKPYSPLTDDALCFQLMVKYQIKVMYETHPNYYHASKVIHVQNKKPFRVCESSNNPNLAICLAIIEAHKND